MFNKFTLLLSRVIEAVLILLGVAIAVLETHTMLYIGLWDLLAVFYLATRISRLRSKKNGADGAEWLKNIQGRRTAFAFTLLTAIIGIIAGLEIVVNKGHGDAEALSKLVGVPAVLLAWVILQFGYAERYAQEYYRALPEKVLVFPNAERPNFVDFAYFAFTLGTTFSVSDVETQTSGIRARILSHSILSFVYNTATLGIAVGVITG
ncbi:DUF1345 domain-containing protein [Streptomyces sp. CRN 30]|uniref:DUF1345 domain-containing protein n=1 Tax=Streptomyces sp. CRN 30 TaxID=3075613 RepID=UPI002A82BBA9|nr:DUF1345 domain-containing protein [Streptomyces sp. CRN 30]